MVYDILPLDASLYHCLITLSPVSPSPYQGEGEVVVRGANAPLKHPQYFGEIRKFNRGEASLYIIPPPLLTKERGIKGVRLVLQSHCFGYVQYDIV